jgi:Cof subfamily protein (haloacid dehalogenase superfamily)
LTRVRALFAADLDGTLVDRNDGIHARDREAIEQARAAGVAVTIATGRLTSRTHPIARSLALDSPMVCADGAVIACAATERVLARRPIATAQVLDIVGALAEHGLSSFIFTHCAIHSCELGRQHHHYVSGWAHDITVHADVLTAQAWRSDPEAAVMVVGIGTDEPVRAASAALQPLAASVECLSFAIPTGRVVRFVAAGASKGTALADVAGRLGLAPDRVAAVGDWFNDVPMLRWAGRSFAMPHAPDSVKASATDVLPPRASEGGAIADALRAWLDELDLSRA